MLQQQMIGNYHTHTYRCNHANGTDEAFVQTAIDMGLKYLGFSDHVMLKDVENRRSRGDYSQQADYIASVRTLQEKYRDRITIYLGYECEAFGQRFHEFRDLLLYEGFDYLILGNHARLTEENRVEYYFHRPVSEEKLIAYRDTLIEGMETGLFSCVAHPDYYMDAFHEWNALTEEVGCSIIDAAVRLHIPLEFNLACFRRGKKHLNDHDGRVGYPMEAFWKIVKEKGAETIIGIDAHHPEDIRYHYRAAEEMLERLGIEPIKTLPFADVSKIRL